MASSPTREAIIDRGAIEHNVRTLRAAAHTREFIAVVKANGYGHGAVASARGAIAGGASRLGVADVAEAIELRAARIDHPVVAWLPLRSPRTSSSACRRSTTCAASPHRRDPRCRSCT
jgi:alanine racemase